jgi:hypothetical protein
MSERSLRSGRSDESRLVTRSERARKADNAHERTIRGTAADELMGLMSSADMCCTS